MNIKSYSFKIMDERMYLIRSFDKAVIIDPFETDDIDADLLGVGEVLILLTHEHFDHVSGVNYLKGKYNCHVVSSRRCHEKMSPPNNESRRFPLLFLSDKETFHYVREHFKLPYSCSADETFENEMNISFAGYDFYLNEVPGHSQGSIIILCKDEKEGKTYLFSGDNILGNGYELRSIEADKDYYYNCAFPYFESLLPHNVTVMPGHGQPGDLKHFLDIIGNYEYAHPAKQ